MAGPLRKPLGRSSHVREGFCRTGDGAFDMNPDYQHWYGWAEMKRDLAEIKDEAAALRKAHGAVKKPAVPKAAPSKTVKSVK